MRKVRASLPQKKWSGLVTKYPAVSDYISPDEFSTGSSNFDVSVKGVVTKRAGGVQFGTVATSIQDQFEAIFVDGTRHLLVMDNGTLKFTSGDGSFTSVKSGFTAAANMEFALYQDRVYFCNGVNNPQVYDRTASYGGAFALPVTITVVDYTGLSLDTVTIGSNVLTEGTDWTAATDNDTTAASLASAIDGLSGISAAAVANVITVTSETPSIVRLSDETNTTLASVSGPRVVDAGATAPSSALSAATGAAGNVPIGTYTYKVTFLYYDSSESNGGTASGSVSPGTPSQINLTNIPIGGYGVTARRIYRDNGNGEGYRLVQTISNNTATTATDDAEIGTSFIPEDNGTLPQFKYVTVFLDRLWMCGVDGASSDVFYTEPGTPDVVRSTGFVTCDSKSPTTGIVVYQDRPVVFNRSSFGQILGESTDSFRYAPSPGNVGCSDNRTIQVRVINGVPTLVWLSILGFYKYNGTTVDYLSDPIENLVNLNLQQADFSKGSNTDTLQADFAAGTASPGIVLNNPAGSVTVANPKATYDTQAAWETASAFTNLVTNQTAFQNPSRIGAPLSYDIDYVDDEAAGGAGATVAPTQLSLPVFATNITGETGAPDEIRRVSGLALTAVASKIVGPVRAGTLTAFVMPIGKQTGGITWTPTIWADAAGQPGSVLATGTPQAVAAGSVGQLQNITFSGSVAISPGVVYWLGATAGSNADNVAQVFYATGILHGSPAFVAKTVLGTWTDPSIFVVLATPISPDPSYSFTQTAVPVNGSWVGGAISEGFLDDATTQTVYLDNTSASYPSGASSTTYVDASNDATFGVGVTTDSVADLNGTGTVSLPRRLYYRARVELSNPDDRNTITYGALSIGFGDTASWTSGTIDHTTDITALNTADIIATIPGGTSASLTVMKSTDDISYNDEGTIAISNGTNNLSLAGITNPTQRYTKLRIDLTSDANIATVVPQVSSAVLKWTVQSNLQSATIDVGQTPAGWDIFSTDTTINGGTVAYELRSATTEGGLSAASYVSVTSGAFPASVPLNRFAQYRATITATADNVPTIESITVAWLLGNSATPIRAASLFHNKNYYVSVAEAEETANNLVLVLDDALQWHRYDGLSIGTMGFFFDRPLVGLANTPTFVRWLSGLTDQGTNITLDVRTKGVDFNDPTKTKVLRSITVSVANTGTTWTFTYSVDGGTTFLPLIDYQGNTSFATTSDGSLTIRKLAPQWPNQISGRTIMVRGVSSDENEAELYEIAVDAFVREGEPTHG